MDDEKKDGEGRRGMVLYKHTPHEHTPKDINVTHQEEQQRGLNTRIAVFLTRHVGTMQTAYSFMVLAAVGLCGILGFIPSLAVILVAWLSQTFIQLVLLPVIMVGQNVLSRHQEILAEEQFNTTMKTYHDIEQMMSHLDAQDSEILTQARSIDGLHTKLDLLLRSSEHSRSRLVKQGMRKAKQETRSLTQEIAAVLPATTRGAPVEQKLDEGEESA